MQHSRNYKILFAVLSFLLSPFQIFAQADSLNVTTDSLNLAMDTLTIDSVHTDSISSGKDTISEVPAFDVMLPALAHSPLHGTSQGGAVYGDYYIVAISNNPRFNIYDLKEQTFICSIPVTEPTPDKTIHANTICFGKTFYKQSDELPLLYVCSSYGDTIADQSHLYVYRLTRPETSKFEAGLVQNITFGFRGWTECVIDCANNDLWVKHYLSKSEIEYLKFSVPEFSEKEVTLSLSDAKEQIRTYEIPVNTQGFLYHDGHIYQVVGVPAKRETCYFVDFNLQTHDYERFTSLFELGMVNPENNRDNKWEPENIFVYQDELYIGFHGFICRLNKERLYQEHNYKQLFERIYQ